MPLEPRLGIVRILKPTGGTAGAGFVVSADGLIATCAHVVEACRPASRQDLPEKVTVLFLATNHKQEVRVLREHWLPREQGDVAILRLEEELPDGVEALPLGSSTDTRGHHFRAYGFPGTKTQDLRAGEGAIFEVLPRINNSRVLQLESSQITQGFSGSPVWDEQTQRVVGMVSDIALPDEHGRGRDTAFATPSESLHAAHAALVLVEATEVPVRNRPQIEPGVGPERLSLDLDWLKAFHRQQAEVAGEKYRPDLHVDLPISRDLAGLGLSQATVDEFALLRKQYRKAVRHIDSRECSDPKIEQAWKDIVEAVKATTTPLRADIPFLQALTRFEALEASLIHLVSVLNSLEFECFRRRDQLKEVDDVVADNKDARDYLNRLIYDCQSIRQPASDLLEWLQASSTRAAESRLYFLTGPAGSGKTHLFLDSVYNALSEKRPALILHGAQFSGGLWTSICDQLGLESFGKDVLLGAMNAAAEAVGLDSGRFVIMVDAINETPVEGYWETNLPVLRAAIALWPNIALAVSCRDTYVGVVDPLEERDRFVMVEHPGFAGREIEATDKYFSHYKLESPRIPLLVPEFTVPLFLRMYCESLADSGGAGIAVGHEGRITIFKRYLNTKVKRVTRKVFTSTGSNLELGENQRRIRSALDALLDRMAGADTEWLQLDDAVGAITAAIGGSSDRSLTIISAFVNEGVLSQEPLYLRHAGDGIAVRVLFQAFSDFLLLKRRLDQCPDPLHDKTLKAWLRDTAGRGILEAATVVLPELYDIELPDLFGFDESDLSWRRDDSEEARRRNNRARHVFQSLAEMLPYRSAEAVTERSVELLNVVLRSEATYVRLYDLLYTIAPQSNNRLNAVCLYHHLARQSMARRDASFGRDVYSGLIEGTPAVNRLARWAAQGPYPSYPDDVIELSAAALMWLLASPNRFMRDWITKALVQLLHGHLPVMRSLIERFWPINDPYLVQRVIVIAFGSLMRGGAADPGPAGEVAAWVRDNVFARPVRPDELMLNAARGIVEWAVAHGCLPESDLAVANRPYGLKIPGNPPSKERIKTQYRIEADLPDEQSYRTIYYSLFDMGDFSRYVIQSNLYRFSRFRTGQPLSDPREQEAKIAKRRWKRFVQSLTEAQRLTLEALTTQGTHCNSSESDSLFRSLAQKQLDLARSALFNPPPPPDISYPADRANRWIFKRVLALGWSPQLFGARDHNIAFIDNGRSEHKAERWGKKYQWIAFHELMARVADNYQTRPLYGEERVDLDSCLRLDSLRDLDPSLPPVDFRDFVNRNENAIIWKANGLGIPSQVSLPIAFDSYHGDIDRFISERRAEPLAHLAALWKDKHGQEWVALHSYEGTKESIGDISEWGLAQTVWLHSWFVSGKNADRNAAHLFRQLQKDSWHFNPPSHERGSYWGELSWMNRAGSCETAGWRKIGRDGSELVEVIDTCEDYSWEGNDLDCSMENSAFAYAPSQFIFNRMPLTAVDEGPAWRAPDEREVFVNTRGSHEEYPQSHPFWVRRDWLQTFLYRENLALVVATSVERLSHLLVQTPQDKREITLSAALLTSDGRFRQVDPPYRSPWPTELGS